MQIVPENQTINETLIQEYWNLIVEPIGKQSPMIGKLLMEQKPTFKEPHFIEVAVHNDMEGITLVDDEKITADPTVKIDSEKIGGPSAGLMFSLEIYSRFQKDDLTDGKKIAGTGTIDPDGTVGRIGGIDQKVVAADKS
ncbi:S16 family serine protease, partial [Listeria monocytogenes]|uniref:S16 family serine protease n=1 Tax=Listeria monocytogenes TaxID=1639 RepID=UPI003D340C21